MRSMCPYSVIILTKIFGKLEEVEKEIKMRSLSKNLMVLTRAIEGHGIIGNVLVINGKKGRKTKKKLNFKKFQKGKK